MIFGDLPEPSLNFLLNSWRWRLSSGRTGFASRHRETFFFENSRWRAVSMRSGGVVAMVLKRWLHLRARPQEWDRSPGYSTLPAVLHFNSPNTPPSVLAATCVVQ